MDAFFGIVIACIKLEEIEMKTNIDKLHKCIELCNKIGLHNLPRGFGKTTILCHGLAGIVEVEDFKTIVVGIPSSYNLCFLLPMLFDIFDEHEIKYKYIKQQNKVICGDKTICLMFTDEVEEKTRGFGEYYYQDVI